MKTKFLNLALVFGLVMGSLLIAQPAKADDPFPTCDTGSPAFFWSDPQYPSIFDSITFGFDGCITPEGWTCSWDFGDGTTSPDCFAQNKMYKADNDYSVNLKIYDASVVKIFDITQTVAVRTHDVAITRFIVPQSARAGQTRTITVYVRNTRYPENVQVEVCTNYCLYPPFGTLIQLVPVRPANRTTAFNFNYTFTAQDARTGKVTFIARAYILSDNWPDDWPVDNDVTALPTRVTR